MDPTIDHKFEAIFKYSNIGIIVSSSHGDIVDLNLCAEKLFEYERRELVGQKIEVLLPKKMRERHVGLRDSYVSHPEVRSIAGGRSLEAIKKSGEKFYVEVSLCTYDVGTDMRIVSFIIDVTQRRNAHDELQNIKAKLEKKVEERTKELSEALIELNHINKSLRESEEQKTRALLKEKELNEMKSRFVSMASHEFQTPLAGILNSAILIEKYQQKPELLARQTKHISTIKNSVQNLTSILRDFLSLEKLDKGYSRGEGHRFDMVQLLANVIDEFQELSPEHHFHFLSDFESLEIFQDESKIRNILLNVISNAVKYSKEGSHINVNCYKDKDNIHLDVTDEGIGIPQAEQSQVFSKFFRAKNALNSEGTGLGLNIVKRYLEIIKGSISIQSTENVGTKVNIKFPRELK